MKAFFFFFLLLAPYQTKVITQLFSYRAGLDHSTRLNIAYKKTNIDITNNIVKQNAAYSWKHTMHIPLKNPFLCAPGIMVPSPGYKHYCHNNHT